MADYYICYRKTADKASNEMLTDCLKGGPAPAYPYDENPRPKTQMPRRV